MEQTSDPMRQIVDYSKPGKKAAFALDGALGAVPAEPAAPQQLPEPAPVPWSYLSDLIEQVGQAQPLTHAQQHQILIQLQHALRSADPEEREGGRYARKMFSSRDDLYADVERTLAQSELADHLGVAARLEQAARTAQRRKALVDEMTALHQAGQWDAVVAAAQELAGFDPEHPDPGGIVSDAKAKIRHADLAERYGQEWAQAAELFSAIEQQQPGYRDAAAFVKDAEQQRQLAAWLDQAKTAAGLVDWDTAVTALENLCAVAPAYRDAGARLERARSARSVKQRRSLVDEMTALHQAGRWKGVVAVAEKSPDSTPIIPTRAGSCPTPRPRSATPYSPSSMRRHSTTSTSNNGSTPPSGSPRSSSSSPVTAMPQRYSTMPNNSASWPPGLIGQGRRRA